MARLQIFEIKLKNYENLGFKGNIKKEIIYKKFYRLLMIKRFKTQ